MPMSISTTSGPCSSARRIASSPFVARRDDVEAPVGVERLGDERREALVVFADQDPEAAVRSRGAEPKRTHPYDAAHMVIDGHNDLVLQAVAG